MPQAGCKGCSKRGAIGFCVHFLALFPPIKLFLHGISCVAILIYLSRLFKSESMCLGYHYVRNDLF